ncbi:unnamed protein product [Pocillopora meandrina]|uniref:Globin domain-containing protein n=1 Tax=Pocillopora meandrina TaxID=46732 RepID=A0AAU9XYB5_9CNID|nr:unnamed protein product [Pocillopora meandrina]
MGCTSSVQSKNQAVHPLVSSLVNNKVSISVSEENKIILRESWKTLDLRRTAAGKKVFARLLELNPNLQDAFPSFRGVALDEVMNSRSLFLHSKRLMAVVEETVLSLDDAKELIEDLTNLGERHLAMSITEKHLKVMEEAFVLMLQDILEGSCSEQIIKAWRELFGFMAKTMLTGQEQASNNLLS